MDDAGSPVPQIEEHIGGLLPQTTRKLKQPKKRVWLPTSARMIAAREDHIKPSFPSDGLVRLVDDIMSGLGHVPPLHMTRSASSKRAEMTEDDAEAFRDIVKRLQDYTLLKSKRVSDNRNKGCPSAPSTLCRDSTPDRRVFSESRTLKKERRKRKLLRRAGFLCTLANADRRDEQLKGAKQPTECAQSGQLTCCPHGLPMQTIQDDDTKKSTNDCLCSDYEMSDSNDEPPMEISQDRDGVPRSVTLATHQEN
ncbi:uncharacterized protein FTJAE_2894 [Fusarium tjaetaba]|uniref:Uncharacterized protein n=1 Tax=Fusarium tjaetaba TaxID=1567544 RepID=A0A8H5S419_9HYPO|nr:uncharacterized protein FTJAE_2894 [Fusarium tjaetaba]KAF5644204.1 hypothetical protein FTJAE_2894 [Fusarium tjaetaba]